MAGHILRRARGALPPLAVGVRLTAAFDALVVFRERRLDAKG